MTDTLDQMEETANASVLTEGDGEVTHTDSPEIEALAIEAGWKPADQWKGDGHMPASEYLKHQVSRAKDKSDEAKSLSKRLDKLSRTSAAMLERQLAEQREELEGRYADLVAANKPAEARRVAKQIDGLDSQIEDDDPAEDFKSRNKAWFNKDEEATALAFGICEREARKGTSSERQLEMAEAAVKKRFPELFGDLSTTRRPTAPAVSAPSTRTSPTRPRQHTAESLPPEARKSLNGFLSRLSTPESKASFTKRYIEEYNKENGQ